MMILVRNPVGRIRSEHLRAQTFARVTVLVALASIVAGCSAANGDGSSPAPPLQLRLVTSSVEGPCSAAPLTSDGPGSACDVAGNTTYQVGESLGVVTPRSVKRDGQEKRAVSTQLDKADAKKFGDVTGKAVQKQLAILLNGKVISAPVVAEPLTTGKVTLTFETEAEAQRVATELGASPTS
jgi:preprotein translocase subunit SecD